MRNDVLAIRSLSECLSRDAKGPCDVEGIGGGDELIQCFYSALSSGRLNVFGIAKIFDEQNCNIFAVENFFNLIAGSVGGGSVFALKDRSPSPMIAEVVGGGVV